MCRGAAGRFRSVAIGGSRVAMIQIVPLLLAAVAAAPADAQAVRPSKVASETFTGCRWGKVTGRSYSIWSYACGKTYGDQRLVPANDVDGFAIVPTAPARDRQIVLRTFRRARGAPVTAILPAVLKVTGRAKSSCRLVEHRNYGDWGTVWLLEPAGAQKRAYDIANAKEPQENPCGALGIGPAGDRFFRVLPADPTRIVYADMGSEIQIFDLKTLRLTSARTR